MTTKKRIVRPDVRLQSLGTVDEGKQLELFAEVDGVGQSLAAVVADESDESLWFEVYIGEVIVQISVETIREALAKAPGEVHSESWYEKHIYPPSQDT